MAQFNRQIRVGWRLASSLACPKCYGRLYGDKTFIWCKTFDCDFHCLWEDLDGEIYSFNENATYSYDLVGSLHEVSKDKVIILFDGDGGRNKKFEILRGHEWKE